MPVTGTKQSPASARRILFAGMLLFAAGINNLLLVSTAYAGNHDTQAVIASTVEPPVSPVVDTELPATQEKPVETKPTPAHKQPARLQQTEAEYWGDRVNALIKDIEAGSKVSKDADALYHQLSEALQNKRKILRLALVSASSPTDLLKDKVALDNAKQFPAGKQAQAVTVEDVYATMVSLYQARIKLQGVISSKQQSQITGTGVEGLQRLNDETEYMLLYLRFHAMAIPQLGPQLLDKLIAAPVPVVWEFLKLLMAVMLFRWWRQWAPQGLVDLRGRILQIRPRTQRSLQFARLIWYFQQVRSPLEWMLLISIIFDVIAEPSLLVIEDFFRIILSWILLAWFAVRLINAIATRGVAGLSDDTSGLRLRSLKLIAGWILILGLGLELTETYTGEGATYAMVWLLFVILSVPVGILLLAWWQGEIAHELVDLPALPSWLEKSIEKRKGMQSYINVILGGVYLVFVTIRQLSIRQLSKLESGREILVTLLGREVSREQDRKNRDLDSVPISSELQKKLLAYQGEIVEKVFSKDLKRITEIVEFGHSGVVALTAERGAGKSFLLTRLAEKFANKAIIVQCTMQGFDAVKQVFSEIFDTPKDQLNPYKLGELIDAHDIRFIALDDLHLLVRPKMGGQLELDRLADFVASVKTRTSWIVAMDKPAYQYARRLRSERAMLEEVIELPQWTQEQISQLIETRCRQAGIDPDFSHLVIPHQYDEADYDTLEERTRAGFYRILSSASGGNPTVALRLWADSLSQAADGRVVVQILPQVFGSDQLEDASLSILLMLRVVAQSGMTTAEDIAASLQLPTAVINNAIRFALLRGWIEQIDDYYQITWRWFRTINRVLARQNLLPRQVMQEIDA